MCAECHQVPCHPRCPNAPEPKTFCSCKLCNEAICEGDNYWEIGGNYYHEECAEDNAMELLVEVCVAKRCTAESMEGDLYDEY